MPLCPLTPSLGHEQVNRSGRVELLITVHGYRRTVRRKASPFVQAQGIRFVAFPAPAFSVVCAMPSLTGRRFKEHVRIKRRLGSGEILSGCQEVSDVAGFLKAGVELYRETDV